MAIDRQLITKQYYIPGFTIVELLVVIVVIGVLATITIVSYTGITQRAIISSLQSDLTNNSNQLKMFQICLLYTSPSPRDRTRSRMPSSA